LAHSINTRKRVVTNVASSTAIETRKPVSQVINRAIKLQLSKNSENKTNLTCSPNYKHWLAELKTKVRRSQLKAAVAVNQALLEFYWDLGSDIVEKQKNTTWGTGFLKQLSQDLITKFPDMKGFSLSNIKYIRQWFLFIQPALQLANRRLAN